MNRRSSLARRTVLRIASYLAIGVFLTAPAFAEPSIFVEPIPGAPPITGGPAWCSIALDDQNAPHVAFAGQQDGVWYSKLGIDGWTTPDLIDSDGGIATGIALDIFGEPHVAYIALVASNPDVYAVKYGRLIGDTWTVETVETGVYPATPNTALAIDAQGNPHLAYTLRVGESHSVRYARKYGGAWTLETVDVSASAPSLALDAAGRPHLAYLDEPGSGLVYGYRETGGWQFEEVSGLTFSCALALDAADTPHIAFSATYDQILTYGTKTGDTWIVETVDPNPNPGYLRTNLAVAPEGTPHLTATRVTSVQLRYATRAGSGWEIQLIDGSAHDAAIALDGAGNPRLTYTHYAGGGGGGAPIALPYYAREAESVEVVAAASDTTLYENGADVVHLTVRTRRYQGPAGPVTLSADLIPTIGPLFHAGDDAFSLAVGEEHVSEFFWPIPDTTYTWEFALKVRLDDGAAFLRSPLSDRFFKNMFQAAKIPVTWARQFMDLIVNCRQLDPATECLYHLAAAVPLFGSVPAGASLYAQDVCKAMSFWKAGDRCRGTAALRAAAGKLKGLLLNIIPLDPQGQVAKAKALLAAMKAAENCGNVDFGRGGRCSGGGTAGFLAAEDAFVDSLAVWMSAGLDSVAGPIADVLLVGGNGSVRVEADGAWTDPDTLGLDFADVTPVYDIASIALTTSRVHRLRGTEDDNPNSESTFRVQSRAAQPLNVCLVHLDANEQRSVQRYTEFAVTGQTLLSLPVRDDQEAFPLFVDFDGNGSIDEIHYPGGIVVVAEESAAPALRTELELPRPNPFNPATTLSFTLAAPGRTTLSIYDPAGRLVARPVEAVLTAGRHEVGWDGRGQSGTRLASGVYFVQLESALATITRQLVLVK